MIKNNYRFILGGRTAMKKLILIILIAVSVFVFTGCNTVGGMGSDIEFAGEKIKSASGTGQK